MSRSVTEKVVSFMDNNSPCPMSNFECSTCGGDKYYVEKLCNSIDTTTIKQALIEIDNFTQDELIQLQGTDGLSNSHLALMLGLLTPDDLKSIYNAWMLEVCHTDAILTLIKEGHYKHWNYSAEALDKLIKMIQLGNPISTKLKANIRALIEEFGLNNSLNLEMHDH